MASDVVVLVVNIVVPDDAVILVVDVVAPDVVDVVFSYCGCCCS